MEQVIKNSDGTIRSFPKLWKIKNSNEMSCRSPKMAYNGLQICEVKNGYFIFQFYH